MGAEMARLYLTAGLGFHCGFRVLGLWGLGFHCEFRGFGLRALGVFGGAVSKMAHCREARASEKYHFLQRVYMNLRALGILDPYFLTCPDLVSCGVCR